MGNQTNGSEVPRFLRGAKAIVAHLRKRGLDDVTEADVYYLARTGKLPIGRLGKELFTSEERLDGRLYRAAKPTAEQQLPKGS